MVQKIKNCPQDFIAKVEASIVAHPKMAVLMACVSALVAEQVAAYVYNSYVASENNEDVEDFDIA